jgi:hypothetical protein
MSFTPLAVTQTAFQGLATAIARSRFSPDELKNDAQVSAWLVDDDAGSSSHAAATFKKMLQAYTVPELFGHIQLLCAMGQIASALVTGLAENRAMMDVEELNRTCRDLYAAGEIQDVELVRVEEDVLDFMIVYKNNA